ncbi:MAG: YeeE/YedE thiosulfate transporter family protein [Bacteroidales bacterium]
MTPLFPLGIIDQGWYLIIIFFIGLFFGLVLEQSGFSSSRKLAGVFYGYDFVVLKVFFTAGITAMSGLVILGYFGLIDLSVIFVNSNFLVSALVGGVIMGFGFILGGFCPGTSVTGAVIGKIDAMVFIAGIFLGIFVFGAFDSTFNKLFTGYYFDHEMISDTFGFGKHFMVFVWILMALAAFGAASYFEKRSTVGLRPTNIRYPRLGAEVFLAILIAIVILFIPEQKAKGTFQADDHKVLSMTSNPQYLMNADELAYMLINNSKKLNIIDVRDEASFAGFHLPGSTRIPLDQITSKGYRDLLSDPLLKTVLVSEGGVDAGKALVLLGRQGHKNIRVLDGGLNQFTRTIFEEQTPPEGLTAYDEISKYRFRQRAAAYFRSDETTLPKGVKGTRQRVTPATTSIPRAGGC